MTPFDVNKKRNKNLKCTEYLYNKIKRKRKFLFYERHDKTKSDKEKKKKGYISM
jgi:hypothetical protein